MKQYLNRLILLTLFACLAVGAWGQERVTVGDLTFILDTDKKEATVAYCNESATSIDIPEEVQGCKVTTIGDEAFSNCTGLTSINFLPEGITKIGYEAFFGCTGLTSINFPEELTSISGGAFMWCSGLTSITFPEKLTSLGSDAFGGARA